MKPCIACHKTLELVEFYRHPEMRDGHLNKCIECVKAYARSRPPNKEYERSRAMLPHRVDARKAYQKTERGKVAIRDAHERSRAKFPEKYKARNAVSNAIRDGHLTRPDSCSECRKQCKPHGHHDDYGMALNVRWLCTVCHRLWHKANGHGKNGGD